ncbi:MAG: nucleotidyltransferase family protein, partial [Desulfatitalea sp.]|nr:nucleotidyltransferase family protein [Desulfatitalea sp.]
MHTPAYDSITTIILAAGRSSRMGRFKPLLPFGDAPVVERVVHLHRAVGVGDVCVVTGHRSEELSAALTPYRVRCVFNPDYHADMYASLLAGIRSLPGDCRGFFVHLVDIPLVRPATLRALLAQFSRHPDRIQHPTFADQTGHPPLIPASLAPALLDWTGDGGLKAFWSILPDAISEVPVVAEGILLDIDTQDDYADLLRRAQRQ